MYIEAASLRLEPSRIIHGGGQVARRVERGRTCLCVAAVLLD